MLHMILQAYLLTTKEELGINDRREEDTHGFNWPEYMVCQIPGFHPVISNEDP